jgi:TonB-linked SusC/RagA family outer membrane protein
MKWKILLVMVMAWSIPEAVFAQQLLTGKVTDQTTNEGLPGVSIVIKGTANGTVTDAEGNYSITAKSSDILVFSFLGFASREVTVGDQTSLDITLETDTRTLEEIVVVGYTTAKKKDVIGAVSVVSLDEVEDQPSGNIMKNIQGRVPGVVVTGNGRPGDGGATIRVRGAASPFTNADPLYIIDGVPTTGGMHEINPNDIESFQVLKDAASASIYGARAANGVVIITTKKGKGGPKISFRSNLSVQQFHTEMDPLNTEQRARVYWQARVNDGNVGDPTNLDNNLYMFDWNGDYASPVLNNIYYAEYIDVNKTMKPANTNWFKEVTRPSMMQDYNLSISDATDRGSFLMSLGYFNHDGVVKESNFKRISGRVNSEYKMFDGKVRVGQNLTVTDQRGNQVNDEAPNIMFLSLIKQTIIPVRTADGEGWGGPVAGTTDRHNPVRLIEDKKQNVYQFNRILGNAYVEVDPVKNLTLRTSLGVDYNIFNFRILDKEFVSGSISGNDKLTNINNHNGSLIWTNTATYKWLLDKHNFQFLLGSESITSKGENFSASREDFSSQDYNYTYLDNGTGEMQATGFGSASALQSFFGRVDYAFNDRYLASVTLRRDGSSRFGKNNQYGNFPSVSAGWRISEESFMQDVSSVISELKLRASWGQNGNQAIDDRAIYTIFRSVYATKSLFTNEQDGGTAYDIGGANSGTLPSGYTKLQSQSNDLKWETTTQTNVGLDFGLFENRLTGSADYFIKETTDFLFLRAGLGAQGEGANQWVNVSGISENKGFEFALTYTNDIGPVNVKATGNIATLRNRLKNLPAEILTRYPGNGDDITIEGRNAYSIYGFITDGLFQSDEEVAAHASQTGAAPGRIRYKDLNDDNVIDEQDQTYIGIPMPDFSYGVNLDLTYKNFDVNFFFQGVHGGVLYNDQKIYTDFASQWVGSNWGSRLLDAWSPSNTGSEIPALTLTDNNNEGRRSTYYLESLSYIKLRNLQVGYTLPRAIAEKARMSTARVFVQGQNLLTVKSKDSTIPDPETPNGQFPIPRTYTVGLNVTF